MASLDRAYEIYNVTTDDEWELTLFRIMPADTSMQTGRSIYFQHGLVNDAEVWIGASLYYLPKDSDNLPAFLALADEGYDVWMGNNRGTKYSNINPRFPNAEGILHGKSYYEQNFKKFDFSWTDMGISDLPALLGKVKEVSGNDKVTYIGYSQGTTQMFYGLASQEETFADLVDKTIMLGPAVYNMRETTDRYEQVYPILRAENVNSINSIYYWDSQIRHVCYPPPDHYMADNRDLACTWMKIQIGEQASTKCFEHLNQLGITQRFQEYVRDFKEGSTEGPLVSPGLSSIKKVPIQLVQGTEDINTTNEGVLRLKDELGDACQLYTEVPGADHYWFSLQAASQEFLDLIRE